MGKIWSGGASKSDGPNLSNLMTKEDNAIDQHLVEYEITGLIAYHLELSKAHFLPVKESQNIISALLKLLESGLKMSEDYEDVHSLVQDKVNELTKSGDNLRVFLSRNDQSHYDIRSFYLDSLLQISKELNDASKNIHETFSSVEGYMPGYTHYRQAMPMAIGTYFDYFSSSFSELAQETYELYEKFKKNCPLGYGSGYGSAVKVDLKSLSNNLGFEGYFENPVFGASHRGIDDVDMATLETKIMIVVSKLAQDFILFSSEEFNFLQLPDGFTTGSSLMPNKRNPDFLEMLEGYASDALGTLASSISMLMNKGIGYHREFQISKDKVIKYTLTLNEIIKALSSMLSMTKIDTEKAKEITENTTNATMNAYDLFTKGTPWKEAYGQIGSKVREGDKLKEYIPEISISYSTDSFLHMDKKISDTINSRKSLLKNLVRKASDFCNSS